MQISVTIENCRQCRHIDHSGAFTSGGAQDICQGPNVIEYAAKAKGVYCPPDYIKHLNNKKSVLYEAAINYIHWRHRRIKNPKNIPAWCPLNQGEGY